MFEILKEIMNIISFIATIFMALLAWLAAKRYLFKKTFYGEEAEGTYNSLVIDKKIVEEKIISKPYVGWNGRSFPSLVIEKKWGSIVKITYYVKEDDKKIEKTWHK